MLQVAPRVWPSDAVHDTVAAVVRDPAFRRSLQSSLLERFFGWMGEWLQRLSRHFDGPSVRSVGVWVAGALVVVLVARLVLAARARDEGAFARARARRAPGGENPWRAAERLAAEGRFEEAAHALYRAVLGALAHGERLRLDPSKTSGDYARELRARGAASYAAFRAFSRRFDVAVYGHGPCDAAALDDLRRLAAPFAPRARAA